MICPRYPTGGGGLSLQRAYDTGNTITLDPSLTPLPELSDPRVENFSGESTSGILVYGTALPVTITINPLSWITYAPNVITISDSPTRPKNTSTPFTDTFAVAPGDFSAFQALSPATSGLMFPATYQWAASGTVTVVAQGLTPVVAEFTATGDQSSLISQSVQIIGTASPLTVVLSYAAGTLTVSSDPGPGTFRSTVNTVRFIGY